MAALLSGLRLMELGFQFNSIMKRVPFELVSDIFYLCVQVLRLSPNI